MPTGTEPIRRRFGRSSQMRFAASAVLLLGIGFFMGAITTSLTAVSEPSLAADVRQEECVVTIEGMRDGTLRGSLQGDLRLMIGDSIVLPGSGGVFAVPPGDICAQTITITVPPGMQFVASRRGKKYYPIGSVQGQRLVPENRIYFPDAASAEKAGYTP